jgi:hypothetical protein
MEHSPPPELVVGVVRAWDRPLILVPPFAAVSLIGGAFASFSWEATAWILLIGSALTWLGSISRAGRSPAAIRLRAGALWWLIPASVLVAVEAVNFLLGSTYAHPTLSVLADPLLDGYFARSLGYFAWISAFWGLVRR